MDNIRSFDSRTPLFLLLLLCLFLRLYGILSPLVDTQWWRQTDTASIAKNFYHDGMHLLYPQVNWRGDTPGYVESEFPLYPYLVALLYRLFGIKDVLGRLVSVLFALFSTWVLYAFSLKIMPDPKTAFLTALFYVISPLSIYYTRTFMPESMLMFFYLGSLYWFYVWIDEKKQSAWGFSLICTTLALLTKLTAAFVFIPLIGMLYERNKAQMFNKKGVWLFFCLSLIFPVLWYLHAYDLYARTGISFGIIGKAGYDKWGAWDLVFSENFWSTFVIRIFGVIASPVGGTFFLLGVILGAVLKGFCSKKYFLYSWLISFMLYYMLVGEGNRVLEYYQLFLVPVAGIFIAQSVLFFEAKISADSRKTASIFTLLVYLMIFFTGFFYVSKHYDYDPYTEQAYLFAPEVQKQTERDSLFIVVDMPRVYERKWLEEMEARIHRPSFLCFIDRHGWEFLPHELNQMPVEEFESLIKKGAKYLLLPRYWFQVSVGLRQYLENKPFPVVTENSQFILFRLN